MSSENRQIGQAIPINAGDIPVLVATEIPHEIRHGAIIGAFQSLRPGNSMVLVAPHNPLPLLDQLREVADLDVSYLQSGPVEWRLQLTKP
ncbi:Uncharacterized conserved protein [Propionibacterium cyclohexanicum]|uniref:Uncharacterized conserved protein n=1 Tax=Propionibacterium cyclohexanicum TaxID=64702 RepID=A0A1H9RIJ9_9ACTN|nr:DUF2249 domain-containing protein [Propionibacterium cyclohexanicum]SER72572.1 Uncharacterized conserved protein [Propionibacterium cyclohexanicum]